MAKFVQEMNQHSAEAVCRGGCNKLDVKSLQTEAIIGKVKSRCYCPQAGEEHHKKKGLHNAPKLGYSVYMRCYAIKEEIFL